MVSRSGFLLLFAAGALLRGTELYTWHSFEEPVVQTSRFELNIHHRTRTRHEMHYLDQVRGGAILRWTLFPKVTTLYGVYVQPQQIRSGEWTTGRRLFAGVEVPIAVKDGLTLSTRLVAERHIATGRPDYNRYRSHTRLVFGHARIAPYFQHELLAVHHGFHSTRNSGGLRMRINSQLTVEAGYLYDNRRREWGGNRQAIVTAVRFSRRSRE